MRTEEMAEELESRMRLEAERRGRPEPLPTKYHRRLRETRNKFANALIQIAQYPSGGVIVSGTPEADRHEMIHLARQTLDAAGVKWRKPR